MALSNKSSWRETPRPREYPPLRSSIEVDVAIIGGGITGVTAAYLLRETGISIALLERGRIGDWATGSTTGFLMETVDTDASDLIEQHDEREARLITLSHRDAISRIETIIQEEEIECEFRRCPAFLYAQDEGSADSLAAEEKLLKKLGTNVSFQRDAAAGIPNHGYLRIERQAKFNSLQYLFSLAERCAQAGVQLFEESEVLSVDENTSTLRMKTGGEVKAKHILMATHYPLEPQPVALKFKKAWYTTYVLEARLKGDTLPEALYEDTANPYHYVRVDKQDGYDRLILGGEDHRSDIQIDERKNFGALEDYLKTLIPSGDYTLTREWKGRIVESGDGLAYIGQIKDHGPFYATAYSGTGLTYATIAAQLFFDHVTGKPNAIASLYSADRPFSLRQHGPKALEYLQEFFGGAAKNFFRSG